VAGLCRCVDGWAGADCSSPTCAGAQELVAGSVADVLLSGVAGVKTAADAYCLWTIRASDESHVVVLRFESLDLEIGDDTLEVFDGVGVGGEQLLSSSGYAAPPLDYKEVGMRCPGLYCQEVVVSSSSAITLRFTSDSIGSGDGFRISYFSLAPAASRCGVDALTVNCSSHGVCSETGCMCYAGYFGRFCQLHQCSDLTAMFPAASGILRSAAADAPGGYTPMLSCHWDVQAPASNDGAAGAVGFYVHKFDLEPNSGDEVVISAGTNWSVALSQPLCIQGASCVGAGDCQDGECASGICSCLPIVAPGPTALVEFKTDANDVPMGRDYKGFQLEYFSVYDCPRVADGSCRPTTECAAINMVASDISCVACPSGYYFESATNTCHFCSEGLVVTEDGRGCKAPDDITAQLALAVAVSLIIVLFGVLTCWVVRHRRRLRREAIENTKAHVIKQLKRAIAAGDDRTEEEAIVRASDGGIKGFGSTTLRVLSQLPPPITSDAEEQRESDDAAYTADPSATFEKSVTRLRALGMSQEHIVDTVKNLRREHSEEAGVSLEYLISNEFSDDMRAITGMDNPNFHDMKQPLFFGENARGRDTPCPRDGLPGCALVDTLPPRYRQKCTHFLSWTWSYSLDTVVGGLSNWARMEFSQRPDDLRQVFLFMCFFCNNQYRLLVDGNPGSGDLEHTFEQRLDSCRPGGVVALLDDWNDSQYLKRIWTIFEQYTAAKVDVPVQMVLPVEGARSLMEEFETGKEGILRVKTSFSKVHSENAVASVPEDERKVKMLIRESIGFETVDKKVRERLQEWVAKEVRAYMDALVDADNHEALGEHCITHKDTMIFTVPDEHTEWGRTRSQLAAPLPTIELPRERMLASPRSDSESSPRSDGPGTPSNDVNDEQFVFEEV